MIGLEEDNYVDFRDYPASINWCDNDTRNFGYGCINSV